MCRYACEKEGGCGVKLLRDELSTIKWPKCGGERDWQGDGRKLMARCRVTIEGSKSGRWTLVRGSIGIFLHHTPLDAGKLVHSNSRVDGENITSAEISPGEKISWMSKM